MLAEMQQLESDLRAAQQELAQYAESDPHKVEAMSEYPALMYFTLTAEAAADALAHHAAPCNGNGNIMHPTY